MEHLPTETHKHRFCGRFLKLIFYLILKPVIVPDSGQLEKKLEDVSLARRDLEDSSRHVKTLEKQMKSITQERDELHKVHSVGVCFIFNIHAVYAKLQWLP